eukprot:121993_1
MIDITAVAITLMIVYPFIQLISVFIHWIYWCRFQHVFLFLDQWNIFKVFDMGQNIAGLTQIIHTDVSSINDEFNGYLLNKIQHMTRYSRLNNTTTLWGNWESTQYDREAHGSKDHTVFGAHTKSLKYKKFNTSSMTNACKYIFIEF